jgi:hypothetical protein
MTTLDKILICNSMISLTAHLYVGIRWAKKNVDREARYFRNAIIYRHVKAGHKGRLKYCPDEQCLSLRTPASHQQATALQPVQAE